MEKKRYGIWVVLLLLLCFVGCDASKEQNGKNTASAPTQSASGLFSPEKAKAPNTGEMSSSKALEEKLEKAEEPGLAVYNGANRLFCHTMTENQNSLFCIDGDTGVVYFVNQEQDYFIYRLKDGKAELAVSLPAKELYCWNGILYFMVTSYDYYELKEMQEGDICAYNPAQGTVELIYAAGIAPTGENAGILPALYQRMTVNENGIYFVGGLRSKQIEANGRIYNTTEVDSYLLPFGAAEPVPDEKRMSFSGWNDYYYGYIRAEAGGYQAALLPRKAVEAETIVIGEAYRCFFIEDEAYYYNLAERKVMRQNLITGEKTEYDCEPIMKKRLEEISGIPVEEVPFQLTAVTITEDTIWAWNNMYYAVCFDRNSGTATCYEFKGDKKAIHTAYTDGHSVYVLLDSGVARVFVEDTSGEAQGPRKFDAEPLVKN